MCCTCVCVGGEGRGGEDGSWMWDECSALRSGALSCVQVLLSLFSPLVFDAHGVSLRQRQGLPSISRSTTLTSTNSPSPVTWDIKSSTFCSEFRRDSCCAIAGGGAATRGREDIKSMPAPVVSASAASEEEEEEGRGTTGLRVEQRRRMSCLTCLSSLAASITQAFLARLASLSRIALRAARSSASPSANMLPL